MEATGAGCEPWDYEYQMRETDLAKVQGEKPTLLTYRPIIFKFRAPSWCFHIHTERAVSHNAIDDMI